MALTMITTSMMLVYILNYRQITDEPFKRVWQNVCERDWERSFGCFKAGVPCFLFSLCCLSWIKFSTNTNWADAVAASMVTALSLITMTLWALYVQTKYRSRTRERDFEDALEAERIMKAVDAERSCFVRHRVSLNFHLHYFLRDQNVPFHISYFILQ